MSTAEIGCTVLIDGAPISDGCTSLDPDAPAVLSGLRIIWGRSSTVDQPVPSSCVFHVADPLDGPRLVPSLAIGRRVDVRADTVVYPDPTVSTIPVLIPGDVSNVDRVTGSGTTANTIVGGPDYHRVNVVYPPKAYTQNPLGWDDVPRTLPGQQWRLKATLGFPGVFCGWRAYAATVQPVTFTQPTGPGRLLPDTAALTPAAPAGDLLFTPPAGVWLGFQVSIYPPGPRWSDLDPTTWAALAGTPTRTTLAFSPGAKLLTSFSFNTAGTGSLTAGWGGQASAVRVTRTTTAAARLGAKATMPLGVPAAVRLQLRASEPLTAVSVYLRADLGTTTGQTTLGLIDVPAGTSTVDLTGMTPPIASTGTGSGLVLVWATGAIGSTLDLTGVQIEPGAAVGAFFDGSTPDAPPIDYAWTGAVDGSSSTATDTRPAVTWDQLATFPLTPVQMLAPAAGAADSALVFSGRITDVIAQWSGGPDATLQVIAQDWLAELANRFVGDAPWSVEALGTRAARIIALSGQPVTLTTDPGVASLPVSYRDVDRQAAAGLLQQLATSCAGILWTATHLVTGQVMRIEDVAARPAALTLAKNGTVHIVPSPAALAHALPITACDVDADPVRFLMDMTDTVSIVAATWLEQTTDPGPPVTQRPTQRTVEVTATNTANLIGSRRLSVSTQLTTLADGTAVANRYLARSSVLAWRIEGLTWDTAGDLAPAEITAVMQLLDGTRRNGLPIALTDLPDWAGPMVAGADQVALYVEGGAYTYTAGSWELALNTSSANGSALGTLPWSALPAAWRWVDFDPAISWLDLYGVTYPPV